MTTTWQHDGHAYTLVSGDFRCRVWRSMGTWQAIVSRRGDEAVAYQFDTLDEAKAWCEKLLTERR